MHASLLRVLQGLFLAGLLSGCYTTREVTLDYPLEPAAVRTINEGGGDALLVLADSQTVGAMQLAVDSVMLRWFNGEWSATPLANVRSILFIDPDEYWSQTLKGVLYGAAGFAAIALVDGLAHDRPDILAQTLAAAAVGGLGSILTRNAWGQFTDPRVRYTIRPPRTVEEEASREADRRRVEAGARASIPDLNARSRRFRVEPGFLLGQGNSINAESDASNPLVIGGLGSFGMELWDRFEGGLELSVASHAFGRGSPDERVIQLMILLTGTFFPLENSGLFVRGGVGLGTYSASGTYAGPIVTSPHVTPPTVTADGIAICLGGGYDFRLNDSWSLRPAIRYAITPLSGLELNDQVILATGRTRTLLLASFSIVFKGAM